MKAIKNLYGLRFILAAMVVYAHVSQNQITGKYAVGVFFILSGFLFGLRYVNGKEYPFSKFLGSIKKIYPSYILTILFFLGLAIIIMHKPLMTMLCSLGLHVVFLQSFVPIHMIEPLNSPTWFLSTYFFVLLFFWVLYRKNIANIYTTCIIAIIGIGLGVIINEQYWWFYEAPFTRIVDFLAGYVLGKSSASTQKIAPPLVQIRLY